MTRNELENYLEEARRAEDASDFLAASFLYKSALGVAGKLNDKEAIRLCKEKVVETNKKSRSQYKEIAVETKVPTEEIRKIVDSILVGDLPQILKTIGGHPYLYPHYERIADSASKSMPISYIIASVSTVSEHGHVVKGGEGGDHSWVMKNYEMHQSLINQLYLRQVFAELAKKDLTRETLLSYLKETPAFAALNLEVVEVGIERYFAKDYVSALHILTPHFEAIFLALSEKAGLDVIALNRGKEVSTQPRTLSADLLSSQPFQDTWGVNLCEQLKFALFDPLGYALRHKIAHGFISKDECHEDFANLIVYFYLALAARIAKKEVATT